MTRELLQQAQVEPVTFEQAWSTYEEKGYRYGRDALEQVRLGWKIAREFTALAAARDCRTCTAFDTSRQRCIFVAPRCTNANLYEALPPVRLWKKAK